MDVILKEIEDESKTDEHIEEKFNSMLITFHSTEIFKSLQNAKYSADELSFLHLAAKNARYVLCAYLIQKLDIGDSLAFTFK